MSGERAGWPDWDEQLNDPEALAARRRDMANSVFDYRNQGSQGHDWALWTEPASGVKYILERRVHPISSKYFYELSRFPAGTKTRQYSLVFDEESDEVRPGYGYWAKHYAEEEPEASQDLFHGIIQNALFHAFDTPPPKKP